jgi:hypothetical protein|tara:strand:+ start:43 stop:399 length:357 start_codon:yes stop_codon:yes gene_type:complete
MTQSFEDGCQCSAVAYAVTDVDLDLSITCNCSRCQTMGFVLTFAPRDSFTLLVGADNLTEYRFNTEKIQHLFCKTCGVESFGYGEMNDGAPIAMINVNCLKGVSPRDIKSQHVDGASM